MWQPGVYVSCMEQRNEEEREERSERMDDQAGIRETPAQLERHAAYGNADEEAVDVEELDALDESRMLGESAVESMTSGQDPDYENEQRLSPEELGGPFIVTQASSEFARHPESDEEGEAAAEPTALRQR